MEREVATGIGDEGITVMGVDILPAELPKEAREHFGDVLQDVVQELIAVHQQQAPDTKGIDTQLLSSQLVSVAAKAIEHLCTRQTLSQL